MDNPLKKAGANSQRVRPPEELKIEIEVERELRRAGAPRYENRLD